MLTYVLGYLLVLVYSATISVLTGSPASDDELGVLSEAMVFRAPLLQALLTLFAARWVSQRAGSQVVAHGVLVGFFAAVFGQVIGLVFALIGGWFGGLWGRKSQDRQEALYRASQVPTTGLVAVAEHASTPCSRYQERL